MLIHQIKILENKHIFKNLIVSRILIILDLLNYLHFKENKPSSQLCTSTGCYINGELILTPPKIIFQLSKIPSNLLFQPPILVINQLQL